MNLATIPVLHPKPLPLVQGDTTPDLEQVAADVFLPNDHTPPEQAVQRIAQTTGSTPRAAASLLDRMVELGHVEQTPAGTYYLAGSTPF